MDAAACGVFATVIPVLLLGSYLAPGVLQKALIDRGDKWYVIGVIVLISAAEIAALKGAAYNGLPDTLGALVYTASVTAATAMGSVGVGQIITTSREHKQRGNKEKSDENGADGEEGGLPT